MGVSALGVGVGAGTWRRAATGEQAAVRLAEAARFSGRVTGRLGVVWSADIEDPVVALTFDDGPDPAFTPRVLEILEGRGIPATFLCMGWNAEANPGLLDEVTSAGHEVGNHSYRHLNPVDLTDGELRDEIVRAHDALAERIGETPRWYRPPRGRLMGRAVEVCNELGHDVLMWSRYPGLSGEVAVPAIRSEIEDSRPGDVLILHDGIGGGTFNPTASFARALAARRNREIEALPEALDVLLERGVRFATASDLFDTPSHGMTGEPPPGGRSPAAGTQTNGR